MCQYAGFCLGGAATGHHPSAHRPVFCGHWRSPHFLSPPPVPTPPRAKGAQHPPSMLQRFSAHSRAWLEDREGQIAALGEGWPGDCWRQHRAGWEPLTLTHAAGAALSSLLVIKLPASQPLPNVSVHPQTEGLGCPASAHQKQTQSHRPNESEFPEKLTPYPGFQKTVPGRVSPEGL